MEWFSIDPKENGEDVALSEVFPGGVKGLKTAVMNTLQRFTSSPKPATHKGDEATELMKEWKRELTYQPLDRIKMGQQWEAFDTWEIKGYVKEEVEKYCNQRFVYPIDLSNVCTKILTDKATGYRMYPNLFDYKKDPKFDLFFPIFRGGVMVGGWLRAFNYPADREGKPTVPRWRSLGLSENGALLYTSALPPVALDAAVKTKYPLVLVESAMGAIRLARMGWWAVGLGGHNLTAKARVELVKIPCEQVIILLDEDAEEKAIDMWSKLQGLKRAVVVGKIPQKDKDPEDLDDMSLREILISCSQLLRETVKAKEKGDKESADLAALALTGDASTLEVALTAEDWETHTTDGMEIAGV